MWHKKSLTGTFEDPKQHEESRAELEELQEKLNMYTKMLADMAGVEDLTALEK